MKKLEQQEQAQAQMREASPCNRLPKERRGRIGAGALDARDLRLRLSPRRSGCGSQRCGGPADGAEDARPPAGPGAASSDDFHQGNG